MKTLLMCGLLAVATPAFAEDTFFDPENIHLSGGVTYKRGDADAFAITYTQPMEHKLNFETSLLYIEESTIWNNDQPDKWTLIGRVSKKFGPVEFGIGLSYSSLTDEYNGSRLNFTEVLRYRFDEHWIIELVHISNAGIVKPNLGRDVLLVGYKF